MPDKRKHRGPAPEDLRIFGDEYYPDLCRAVADLSMLLSRGYARTSSLKLVGDRFSLTQRQRLALMRSACSDAQLQRRTAARVQIDTLPAQPLVIDGYNLLITTEAALSGAAIFIGRDQCCRDLSGIHGSYRTVSETLPAFELIAKCLDEASVSSVRWLFDRPVSNSGKLKVLITQLAEKNQWPWQVELLTNPDAELIASDNVIATSDSDVIDKCDRWTNLVAEVLALSRQPDGSEPFVVDLSKCDD